MIALYLLILVDSISVSVVIPLLGPLLIDPDTQVFLIGSSLDLRSTVSGLMIAVYVLLMLYMAPALGRLSDQVGRKPVLLACGIGVLLGNLLAGLGSTATASSCCSWDGSWAAPLPRRNPPPKPRKWTSRRTRPCN